MRAWNGCKWNGMTALAAVLIAACITTPAAAATQRVPVTVAGGAGSVVPVSGWEIQSSAEAQQSGQAISEPGHSTKGWYPVSANATVMAGLLENGEYPNVFYGLNLQGVRVQDFDYHHFQIPWWYRTTFQVPAGPTGLHTFIKVNGIIPSADLWLNGKQIADRHEIAGAYTTHTLDVTRLVHPGTNVLAVKIYPANPQRDLSIGWIDWNPAPPDHNMGIWRNVDIVRSGPVSLHDLHVLPKLQLPGMRSASVTVKAELRSDSDVAQTVAVSGDVAGITFQRSVHLAPHQTQTVTFDPATTPALRFDHPKVWWPTGMGAQPLYHLALTAKVDGTVSDRAATTFGIRDVSSYLTKQGYRQFVINGVPLLIRGGGWAPDMFLRDQPRRLAAEFSYIRNLGLNAIRTEGKLERSDFYRLADREGILILAGWECCDKWEAWAKTGGEPWNAADLKIAGESMASEARRLRDHPSVIAFLIGSDNAPPPRVAQTYVAALHAADWPDPIISAASAQKTQVAGPSGMKMSGPYAWVPPNYWYADKEGGAFGFNSETSAGVDIPSLTSLRTMLTPLELKALWKYPDVKQYHAGPFWSRFSRLKIFDTALAHRYGAPKSLADYVEKAQLANYEAVRAQFEAYDAHMDAKNPSTGVIYWMFNNAWPSLHWHLIGYDLNPAGAYFGAKEANQPVHIQYSYDNRAVMAINHTLQPIRDLGARIRVYNLDSSIRYDHKLAGIDLPANRAEQLAMIPALQGLSGTYFVELELTRPDGHAVSRNVYWLSSKPDQLDWAKSNWYMTPVSRYADLTALQQLPPAKVKASAHTGREGNDAVTTVTLAAVRGSGTVAFFMHLSLRQADGKPVTPILWSGNDVTLWPGESTTLTARYPVSGHGTPTLRLHGWNVSSRTVPAETGQESKLRNSREAMR